VAILLLGVACSRNSRRGFVFLSRFHPLAEPELPLWPFAENAPKETAKLVPSDNLVRSSRSPRAAEADSGDARCQSTKRPSRKAASPNSSKTPAPCGNAGTRHALTRLREAQTIFPNQALYFGTRDHV